VGVGCAVSVMSLGSAWVRFVRESGGEGEVDLGQPVIALPS
jgi:hypothetical protein